jgi:hypothetical protein
MSEKRKSALSQPPAPERRFFDQEKCVRTTPLRLVVKPT